MEGQGEVEFLNSTLGSVEVDWRSRAGETEGKTSPEELIAAAHSACYSMALSHALAGNGTPPEAVSYTHLDVYKRQPAGRRASCGHPAAAG